MISFFPNIYPDELAYSVFARYGVRAGYTNYRAIADDLFVSNSAKPNLEFIIELSQDTIKAITNVLPFERFILNHTMFSYYARFLPPERKSRAWDLILKMDKRFNDALYIRRNKTVHRQWLRYCPLCVDDDRERYGETYWHRLHQLDHVDVCPKHGCYLHNSEVTITSKDSPSLIHAETVMPAHPIADHYGNNIEQKVAKYVADVFSSNFTVYNAYTVGAFLNSKMEHTKYLSERGKKRYVDILVKDFNALYIDLPNKSITMDWQIEKIFLNQRCHTYDICLLAFFLGVTPSELMEMKLPENSLTRRFDDQIIVLRNQGFNYRQISEQMGISYDYCKRIGRRAIERLHKSN